MEDLISVIVPVFNSEKYLGECIESILNQSYSNIEIILVDDGSTDSSLDICQKYANADDRIKIVNKGHTGVSNTRNIGISLAKGDFITFVDSDDWLDRDYIRTLYDGQKQFESEVVVSGFKIDNERCSSEAVQITDKCDVIDSVQALAFACNSNKPVVGFTWCKLYKRSIIIYNNIKFDETITVNEDSLFNYEVVSKCSKIVRVPTDYYHYRIRTGSITSSARTDLSKFRTKILAFTKATELDIDACIYNEFFTRVSRELFKTIISYIHLSFRTHCVPDDISDLIKLARKAKRRFPFNSLSLVQRVEYILCVINYRILYFLIIFVNKKKNNEE
ncbi:MAG: glycosyltransferase [Clostridiales bacterium]|nr:glycosyltransferase [Clostridiales bacterium]